MAKAIYDITVVDMGAEQEDVVFYARAVGASPQEAVSKVLNLGEAQQVLHRDHKYYVHILPIGPLPNQSQVLLPTAEAARKIALVTP